MEDKDYNKTIMELKKKIKYYKSIINNYKEKIKELDKENKPNRNKIGFNYKNKYL